MESITMVDQEALQPLNSTEEADDDQEQDVVRLYECVFCKRGFTTAQALGGHMNIHRKDRAKGSNSNRNSNSRPINDNLNTSNCISSKLEEYHSCYAGPRFCEPVFGSYVPSSYVSPARSDYTTYLSSALSTRLINNENDHQVVDDHGVITSPSSFRLKFGWSNGQDPKRAINGGGNEEDEVDLELRLGHDP